MQQKVIKIDENIMALKGFIYSISDRNNKGEFVVVKLHKTKQTVEEARIVKAGSKQMVKNIIRSGRFEKYPILEGSDKKAGKPLN